MRYPIAVNIVNFISLSGYFYTLDYIRVISTFYDKIISAMWDLLPISSLIIYTHSYQINHGLFIYYQKYTKTVLNGRIHGCWKADRQWLTADLK